MVTTKTCELHGSNLEPVQVPVRYGLPLYDDARCVADRLFPNANSYLPGGCVVDASSPRQIRGFVCIDCRKAEIAWREQNDAYYATSYVIDDGTVKFAIHLGGATEPLQEFLRDRRVAKWAFLTAWNPLSQPLSATENESRQIELIKMLDEQNYPYLRGFGVGDDPAWEPEQSLFILDISRDDAIGLARRFEQNAILWGEIGGEPELVWCV